MKKTLVFLSALIIMISSTASTNVSSSFNPVNPVNPFKKATEIYMPIGNTGKQVSLMALTQMSAKEYSTLTGRHMNLIERMAFKKVQKELKHSINADGTVNVKKLENFSKKVAAAATSNRQNLKTALILLGTALVLSIIGAFVPFVWIIAALAWLAGLIFLILYFANM